MTISLRRRLIWIAVGGVPGLLLSVALGAQGLWPPLLCLAGVSLTATGIAVNSCLRHSADPELQPEFTVPAASAPGDQGRGTSV